MIWLDGVLAQPVIGLRHRSRVRSSHDLLSMLRPKLQQLVDAGHALDVASPTATSIEVTLDTGYKYRVDDSNLIVEFAYSGEVFNRPGLLPELRYKVETQRYSRLLVGALEHMVSAYGLLSEHGQLNVIRFGLMSDCRLDDKDLPPGIEEWARSLRQPFGETKALKVDVLGIISEADGTRDQCHHVYNKTDERGDDIRVRLDWQRVWEDCRKFPRGRDRLRSELEVLCNAGLRYVEQFGTGDVFDEG